MAFGVTGGGNAKPDNPQTEEELISFLTDKTPRVIHIKKTFDFTRLGKKKTEKACAPWKECSNGNKVQYALNFNNWCENKSNGVEYNDAAIQGIKIKSHKTLLGIGKSAGIRGKGLIITGEENIIIRNIAITFLNPHLVWGGDAIALGGIKKVWIDHCTIKDIGRMMIGSSNKPNKGLTLSNNLFDGKTAFSTNCKNQHYWGVYLSGPEDEVTMANNCLVNLSGRAPRVSGFGNVKLHYYNNFHTGGNGHAWIVSKGGTMLAEGNVFLNHQVSSQKDKTTEEKGGVLFAPFSDSETAQCKAILGRSCEKNSMIKSSDIQFGKNPTAIGAFKGSQIVSSARVLPTSQIREEPPGGCGAGKMDQ
ncbi:pectin lyase fold/virulence factor [Phakopsora pachyrhizi]|uniref:pectin lyase n=1 Tax=Phakopsora pachyrhizi TaxID=170000 RepID=A0AAV0APG4_PHAPC|nr:pectin lyase fold/virulence factor [Phakopsora pachyrhizi]